MRHTKYQSNGFTIVEILVVLVVMSIIVSITVVSYRSVQNNAQANALATEIRNVDRSFRALATKTGMSTWWIDNALTGSGSPSIQSIMTANADFSGYIKTAPKVSGLSTTWTYINNGNARSTSACDNYTTTGVNLAITGVTEDIISSVDKLLQDDGSTTCGKVRWGSANSTTMIYQLSFSQPIL